MPPRRVLRRPAGLELVISCAPRCWMARSPAPIAAPVAEMLPQAAPTLARERELHLERVVDLDRLPAQERGRVPAMLERVDHGAIHEREAFQDPAIAHHSLRADHAFDDHQSLHLTLEGLRGVLRVRTGQFLRRRHRVIEFDGTRPESANLPADLATDDPTHHASDHASLDAAFYALILLRFLHRR